MTVAARLGATCGRNCVTHSTTGEVLLGDLYRSGFDITEHADDADVIVVNTCGFIEDAKSESIDVR